MGKVYTKLSGELDSRQKIGCGGHKNLLYFCFERRHFKRSVLRNTRKSGNRFWVWKQSLLDLLQRFNDNGKEMY